MKTRGVNIVFVDYTQWYYSIVAKTPVPDMQSGKFVQIRNKNTEYLIFSPKELTPYHADIVERFCRDQGIDGAFEGTQKHFTIYDTSWVIVGGGKFEINQGERSVRLYDDSMAYGKFDPKGLDEKIRRIAEMANSEVKIE